MPDSWLYVKAIVVVFLILAATLYALRYMAKSSKRSGGFGMFNKSENIKIIDSLALAKDKQLLIVAISGRAFLLGVSSDRIEKLEELDLQELKLDEGGDSIPGGNMGEKFKSILSDRFKTPRK